MKLRDLDNEIANVTIVAIFAQLRECLVVICSFVIELFVCSGSRRSHLIDRPQATPYPKIAWLGLGQYCSPNFL